MKYRYILVDDEKLTRLGTLEKLSALKDEAECVGQASDGREGLALMEQLHPDIVVTDMKMPVMDGIDFLSVLTERYPGTPIIVISGYRDFEYSHHAIRAGAVDYLLKPFSEADIQNAMRNAMKRLADQTTLEDHIHTSEEFHRARNLERDQQQLLNLLCGYSDEQPQITSDHLKYLESHADLFLVILYSKTDLPEEELQSCIAGQETAGVTMYLGHPHVKRLGYLLAFETNAQRISGDLYGKLLSELQAFFHSRKEQVLFGISTAHPLEELRTAFRESVTALNSRTARSEKEIYRYPVPEVSPKAILWDDLDRLLFYVEAGMAQETSDTVDSLFAFYKRNPELSLYDIKYSCIQIAAQVKSVMSRYIRQIKADSIDASIHNILDTMFSTEEICSYYRQFFVTVSRQLAPESIYSDSDIVENVRVYIEHNYRKELTAEFVASIFHMNRSYLSHIFKKKTGVSFIDYVNGIRIKEAKQLLLHSDKKTYQVAKAVGYDNVSYFCRVFKKFEHTTPEKYRESGGSD